MQLRMQISVSSKVSDMHTFYKDNSTRQNLTNFGHPCTNIRKQRCLKTKFSHDNDTLSNKQSQIPVFRNY